MNIYVIFSHDEVVNCDSDVSIAKSKFGETFGLLGRPSTALKCMISGEGRSLLYVELAVVRFLTFQSW